MKILHAFWQPNSTDAFACGGHFRLWVESDHALLQPKTTPQDSAAHPFGLPKPRWPELLETLGLIKKGERRSVQTGTVWLPSHNNAPLPSPELAHRLGDWIVGDDDDPLTLSPWQVETFALKLPWREFRELRFLAEASVGDVRLGSDLLFWHWFMQQLKQLLLKDQYLPGFRYHQPPTPPRRKTMPPPQLYPLWQWAGRAYAQLIEQAVPAMPAACAAGTETGYEPATLLAHCAAVTLDTLVLQTPLPATVKKQFENSILDLALDAKTRQEPLLATENRFTLYHDWRRWHQVIEGSEQAARFTLGLRLLEPTATNEPETAPWTLELIVIPRDDPSQRLALADYWKGTPKQRKAWCQQLGEANFERLLLLNLGLAARIYPKLWEGMNTAEPQAVTLTLDEAFDFLKDDAWVLEYAGYKVVVPAWWTPSGRRRVKMRLRSVGSSTPSAGPAASNTQFGLDQLLQYRYTLNIGDEEISEAEWRALIEAKTPLVRFRGQWIELDPEKMREMLSFWQRQGQETIELTLPELLQKTAQDDMLEIDRDSALAEMLDRLRNDSQLELAEPPAGLNATLRDYQRRGLSWIGYLEQLGMNGCLADDMGLGKTIQVIAQLVRERADGATPSPTLLVAPTSVLGNWQREVKRFAPQLNTLLHHGAARQENKTAFAKQIAEVALVITSYSLVRKDVNLLSSVDWHRVVLDEAQNIKNPKAAQTKAACKLPARHRLVLTGTPVENRLTDLWSLFQFLQPGYLGTQAQFRKTFELPVQRDQDPVQTEILKQLVQPFILRRVKTDKNIISDLPDKLEAAQYCQLSREQGALYESLVRDVERQLEQAEGAERSGLMLSTLMKLKQICNHPAQFLQDGSPFTPERSHKLQRLHEMLEEAMTEGDSVLLFTQFTEIGEQIERLARQHWHLNTFYLHGGTTQRRREQMIAEFQEPTSPPSLFVLSLKAGGVGITLTRANHVFHFDRWWNPAVENQASDRAFRIGQEKTVFVHKFITMGTLEERIDAMIEDKKALAGAIIGNDESWLTQLDNDRFKALIRLNHDAVGE